VKNIRLTGEQNDWAQDGPSGQVELSPSDSLFAMLDGQIIRGRHAAWRAEVVSIVTEGRETWVQVGRAGHPGSTVVLHMDQRRRAGEAIDALRHWTDIPEDNRPGRIELLRSDERPTDTAPVFLELEWQAKAGRSGMIRH
jgi:hypothetical protein